MKNSERDELRIERSKLLDLLQGMLGFLQLSKNHYESQINEILIGKSKDLDWEAFTKSMEQAREIQEEANLALDRIWEIDFILMNNPNTREILKSGSGGVLGAKLRAKKIQSESMNEKQAAIQALKEWGDRISKIEELKAIYSSNISDVTTWPL